MRTMTLAIQGMSCGHCVQAVTRALARLDGVTLRSVEIGRAELVYDESRIEAGAIVAAVTEVGYPATPRAS